MVLLISSVLRQAIDQFLLVGLAFDVEVGIGHADQLFDIRAADQGPAQHHDLLVDIGLDRQPGHQGLEDRLGVHEDTRRSFVFVGDAQNDAGCDCADQPREQHPQTAVLPCRAKEGSGLLENFFHLIWSELTDHREERSTVVSVTFG